MPIGKTRRLGARGFGTKEVGESRIFGGKKFRAAGFVTTKSEANEIAANSRKAGFNARIVKVPNGFVVFERPKGI